MSRTVKMAKSIANTNPPSSLVAAHCMATVKEKIQMVWFWNFESFIAISASGVLSCFPEVQWQFGQQIAWDDICFWREN